MDIFKSNDVFNGPERRRRTDAANECFDGFINSNLDFIGDFTYIVDIENKDSSVPKARFSTPGSACLDLYTREDITVPVNNGTGCVTKIPLNIKLRPRSPRIYARLYARSSTCLKYNILVANSVGIIDNDFNDEVCLLAINFGNTPSLIPKGTKIAQLEFCVKPPIDLNECIVHTTDDHRGFGSTGSV